MTRYPITYSPGFIVFWGVGLSTALICGGLLSFAAAASLMLMLFHHEHAHLKEIEKRSATVMSVSFGFWGAAIDMKDYYPEDEIEIHRAGIVNSACYAAYFLMIIGIVIFFGVRQNWNFADSMPLGLLYWMQFVRSLSLMSVVLVLTNIAPIWWNTKKYGIITTDGFAMYRKMELRDELWNDGKYIVGN